MLYLCAIFDWLMSHHFSNVYPCLLNYILGRGCPIILSVMNGLSQEHRIFHFHNWCFIFVVFDWLMSHRFSNVYQCLLNFVFGRGCLILSVMTGLQLKIVTCFSFSFLILQTLFLIMMIISYLSSHGFKMGDVYFLISLRRLLNE